MRQYSGIWDWGFEILDTQKGRDDLILRYNNEIAVVEIKGVTGSAAEKHAAQLEKWVSTFYEENEIKPKGILVVNTYRDQPLINRPEVSFPHQMLKFCTQREHCLLTSTQLLSLYLDVKNDPLRKDELIQQLFNTVGILEGYSNPLNYVTTKNLQIKA